MSPLRSWQRDIDRAEARKRSDDALHEKLSKMANDPRWFSVKDSTPVLFDEEWTTWGALGQNDKTMVGFSEDGTLVGGMPF
jgi:hypothetical protein